MLRFFFFKQKTAYEMRISDWSSDVCSSDLTVIYDVELTLTLPVTASITSALNAAAHAVEALYAPDATPLTDAMAEAGLRAIGRSLKAVAANPLDREARENLLCGAWLCGTVLGRSEEHTSELQSLMRISYAVFCLKKKHRAQNV